jgi:hypothetical protein
MGQRVCCSGFNVCVSLRGARAARQKEQTSQLVQASQVGQPLVVTHGPQPRIAGRRWTSTNGQSPHKVHHQLLSTRHTGGQLWIRQALNWAVDRGRCWAVAAPPPSGGSDVSVEASGEIGSHPCRPNSACHQVKGRLNGARTTAAEDRLWSGYPGDSFEGETEMSPPVFYSTTTNFGKRLSPTNTNWSRGRYRGIFTIRCGSLW